MRTPLHVGEAEAAAAASASAASSSASSTMAGGCAAKTAGTDALVAQERADTLELLRQFCSTGDGRISGSLQHSQQNLIIPH